MPQKRTYHYYNLYRCLFKITQTSKIVNKFSILPSLPGMYAAGPVVFCCRRVRSLALKKSFSKF